MTQKLNWNIVPWSALDTQTLYDILQLRTAVFVLEQNCPYQEVDGKDQSALHVCGYSESNQLMAYSRILQPGISYSEVSLGRIATHEQLRGSGTGKDLMEVTLKAVEGNYGKIPVRISAQQYLIRFYEAYRFEVVGEGYLEDDIPHIQMLKTNW